MPLCSVVSVRGKRPAQLPDVVYCGRACHGWPASPWGNPFIVGKSQAEIRAVMVRLGIAHAPREQVNLLELFKRYVLGSEDLMARLPELKGRILACWCGNFKDGDPVVCHAQILRQLVLALEVVPPP